LSAPIAGSLSDRASSRWAGINIGMAAGIAGLALIAWGGSIWILLIGVFLVAINGGVTFTIIPALVRDLNHNQQSGRLMGVLATSADAGMAIGPLVVYGLIGTISLSTVYLITALALLSGVPLILLAARHD
jgi:MFS family permease